MTKAGPSMVARTTHRLIDRSDLLAALDMAPKKVTIISATAGSGKTSLLRAWADRPAPHHRLAVVQVLRDQHDAQQFWLALLRKVLQATDTTNSAEPPAATPAFNGRAMVDRVLSMIADHHGHVVLVIDDLHELTAPDALAQLTRLLTNLPPNARAILATRRDLPLRLHQLRLAGEFDEAEQWLQRTTRILQADSGPDIRLLVHVVGGMVQSGRGRHQAALQEFSSAEYLGSQLAGPHALASQVSGWIIAAYARVGRTGEARAVLATLTDERANRGEIRNATAVICLAEGDPAAALRAAQDVLDGAAPVVGYVTTVETYLLAGLAHWELGDQQTAKRAAERALGLAEPDRLVLPFVVTGAAELLKALPRHETAHAALLADLLDILDGSSAGPGDQPLSAGPGELSPGELKVLRYLPTHLSRSEIAAELSVSVSTVSTHIRSIYAKLQARDRSSAVQRARELRLLAVGRAR